MADELIVKVSSKSVFAAGALLVLLILFVGASASDGLVLNFANPPVSSVPTPGHSSASIVVNVSGSGACSGNITLQQAIDNGCLFPVGKCSADEVIMGDGSCLNLNNAIGETVTNILSQPVSLNCQATPAITTVGDGKYHAYDVPASCRGGSKCILKIEYYAQGSLWLTRTLEYMQYTDNRWTSSIYTAGNTFTNGDSTSNWVDYAAGGTYWVDDVSAIGETSATKWSLATALNWQTKIYVCTYS